MVEHDLYKASLKLLNAYIWEQKLRHTMERETILEIVCTLSQPFMPCQVIKAAEAKHISQATIYNALQLFEKIGIIQMLERKARSKSQYEVITTHTNRLRLICKKCGRVSDFKDLAITNAVRLRKYSNFNPEHFTIFVYGECKHCRK